MKAIVVAGIVSALASAVPAAADFPAQPPAPGAQARASQAQQKITVFEGVG